MIQNVWFANKLGLKWHFLLPQEWVESEAMGQNLKTNLLTFFF